MVKPEYLCRLFCFYFSTDTNKVIEYRIEHNNLRYRLFKGLHVNSHEMPKFELISFHKSLQSGFLDSFRQLRRIEIDYRLYPQLDSTNMKEKIYIGVIDRFIYANENLGLDTFCVYGSKLKLPNHERNWEYYRPIREKLYKYLGYTPSLNPNEEIKLNKLMQEEIKSIGG